MSVEIEAARIELELAEDAEKITAAQILRWLRNRPTVGTPAVIASIERATRAVGRANRIMASQREAE